MQHNHRLWGGAEGEIKTWAVDGLYHGHAKSRTRLLPLLKRGSDRRAD